MTDIDTTAILRDIYGARLDLHLDLNRRSDEHRLEHNDVGRDDSGTGDCDVYPSSPGLGPLWPFLAAALGARRFLEVGCGLGYTAALMAEAGGPDGRVDTIEGVEEHADLAEAELASRGLSGRVTVLRGRALDVLPTLRETYDVIFLDGDWSEYPDMLPDLARLTRIGGLLVSDNLFSLFSNWAQGMGGGDAVKRYLTDLVADPRFVTHIFQGNWEAWSYRVGPAAAL